MVGYAALTHPTSTSTQALLINAPLTTCEELRLEVDDVVCLQCP